MKKREKKRREKRREKRVRVSSLKELRRRVAPTRAASECAL